MKVDYAESAAKYSAINAYTVLVLGFIGLKTAFSKDMIDFAPILVAVFLLILNNSVRYYNAVPCFLALILSIVLFFFLVFTAQKLSLEEPLEILRLGIMALSGIPAIYYIARLIIEKLKK